MGRALAAKEWQSSDKYCIVRQRNGSGVHGNVMAQESDVMFRKAEQRFGSDSRRYAMAKRSIDGKWQCVGDQRRVMRRQSGVVHGVVMARLSKAKSCVAEAR